MPCPGAELAETVPPWAATMAATMESPSPLPPRWCGPGPGRPGRSARRPCWPPRPACPGRCRAPRSRAWSPIWSTRTVAVVPWRRVRPHVGQQVVEDLAQAVLVAGHLDRARPPRTAPATSGPTAVAVRTASETSDTSSTGAHLHRHALVEAGQGEQVVDQPVHARRLGADARDDPRQVLGVLGAAPLEELGVGRHGGDGRAQLVRGVGHELAQVLLVLLAAAPRRRTRAANAAWIRSSITLRARARRPTSVGSSAPGHTLVEVAGRDGVGRAPRRPRAGAGRAGPATNRRQAPARGRRRSRPAR